MHDMRAKKANKISFEPLPEYSDMTYADFIKKREDKNLAQMGTADLHRKQTQMPTFKSFVARMQAQNFPGKTIVNAATVPLTGCITPVNPDEVEDPNKQYVTASFSLKGYERRPDLSSHPVRQYVSNTSQYKPVGQKDIFIPGTSRPIPPVIFQTQLAAAAKAFSVMRHQNIDTSDFEKIFRWMWGLPPEFTLEPYAPLIDSDVTKPWIHMKTRHNYEVPYMAAQQGMIHVTTGSETGVYGGKKYEVDWEFIRTVARGIMTRVLFIEDHRNILDKMVDFRMKFYVRYDNHFLQYAPKWAFQVPKGPPLIKMPNEQLFLLAGAVAEPNKIFVFPKHVVDYMTITAPISIPTIATLPKKLPKTLELEIDEPELRDTAYPAFTYHFVQPLEREDEEIVRRPLTMRDLAKQYLIQYGMSSKTQLETLFTISAYNKFKSIDSAYKFILDKMDIQEIGQLCILYTKINQNKYSSYREIWDFFVGKESQFQKIQSLDPRFLLNHARYLHYDGFIKAVSDAIKCIQNRILVPNAYTLTRYVKPYFTADENLVSMRKGIRELIQRFFVISYCKKKNVAKQQLLEEEDPDVKKGLKANILKYQFLSKLFPLINGNDDPKVICQFMYEMAIRYVKKRSRFHTRFKNFEVKTQDPMKLAKQLDELLKSKFVYLLQCVMDAVEEADKDLDILFMTDSDYLIYYNQSKRFNILMRKMTKYIMPKFIRVSPNREIYVASEEDIELYRSLELDDNIKHIPYASLSERYKVPKLMKNKPQFMSRPIVVKVHSKKKKGINKHKYKEKEKEEKFVDEPPLVLNPKFDYAVEDNNTGTSLISINNEVQVPIVEDDGMSFLDEFDTEDVYDFSQVWPQDYINAKTLMWNLEAITRLCDAKKIPFDSAKPSTLQFMDSLKEDYNEELCALTIAIQRAKRKEGTLQITDIIQ